MSFWSNGNRVRYMHKKKLAVRSWMWKHWWAKVCKKWCCNHLQGKPTGLLLLKIPSCILFGVPLCTTLMTFHFTPIVYQMCILNFVRHDCCPSCFSSCFCFFFTSTRISIFMSQFCLLIRKKKLQAVEAKCTVRSCIKIPTSLGPPPSIDDWGCVPSIEQFGLSSKNVCMYVDFVYCTSIQWTSYAV